MAGTGQEEQLFRLGIETERRRGRSLIEVKRETNHIRPIFSNPYDLVVRVTLTSPSSILSLSKSVLGNGLYRREGALGLRTDLGLQVPVHDTLFMDCRLELKLAFGAWSLLDFPRSL